MREIRQYGSEGGVAPRRHPYPYPQSCRPDGALALSPLGDYKEVAPPELTKHRFDNPQKFSLNSMACTLALSPLRGEEVRGARRSKVGEASPRLWRLGISPRTKT